MGGMGGSLGSSNPVIVQAFHDALRRQSIIALALILVALAAWIVAGGPRSYGTPGSAPEPKARRLLRVSFGGLWVLDGILQAQSAMPLGLPSNVVRPAAATSPGWVQSLVNDGLTVWTRHPIAAASATVWIQVGIGGLLLVGPRGLPSRFAGVAAAYWGLIVWVFGEAFGGVFAPGLSWMFGAPGAALIYALAGLLVALPDPAWEGPRLGRMGFRLIGVSFVGMALLQAWPGRGFWQGQTSGAATSGGLTTMVQSMSQTPQPAILSSWLSSFAGFDARHGWAVNLFVVVALAAIGLAFITVKPGAVRYASAFAVVLSLADWVLVEDLGFLGGVGTDPNSMIPWVFLIAATWLALRRPAVGITSPEPVATMAQTKGRQLFPVSLAWSRRLGFTSSLAVAGLIALGALPMGAASFDPHPDTILTEALNGNPDRTDTVAPPIDLVDQRGAKVTLGSLRGRTVALTFLDPVCTSDCPAIAQQFRQVDETIGSPRQTAFVAINANPTYRQTDFLDEFDRQEHLTGLGNWYFLTGSLAQLADAWKVYGIQVETGTGGSMIAHSDNAFVIDSDGHLRYLLGADPGDDASTAGSLATLLTAEMRSVMNP